MIKITNRLTGNNFKIYIKKGRGTKEFFLPRAEMNSGEELLRKLTSRQSAGSLVNFMTDLSSKGPRRPRLTSISTASSTMSPFLALTKLKVSDMPGLPSKKSLIAQKWNTCSVKKQLIVSIAALERCAVPVIPAARSKEARASYSHSSAWLLTSQRAELFRFGCSGLLGSMVACSQLFNRGAAARFPARRLPMQNLCPRVATQVNKCVYGDMRVALAPRR